MTITKSVALKDGVDKLPPLLQKAIHAVRKKHGVPLELATISVLATANLAAATNYKVDTIAYGEKPLTLYFLGLVSSGGRKSTVLNDTQKGLLEWIRNVWEPKAKDDLVRFDLETELYKDAKKEWLKEQKAGNATAAPIPPRPNLNANPLVSRGTTNGIIDTLTNSPFVGLITDEATMFFGGHSFGDANRSMEFVGLLTKIWDEGAVEKLTGMTAIQLRNRVGTFLGLAQPGAIAEVANNPKFEAQGFWPRVLISHVPDFGLKMGLLNPISPEDNAAMLKFATRTGQLMDAITFEEDDQYHYFEVNFKILEWEDDAKELYEKIYDFHADRTNNLEGDAETMRPFSSRLTEQTIRLAGTIAAFSKSKKIGVDHLESAFCLTEYFYEQKQGLTLRSASSTNAIAEKVISWIEKQQDTKEVTLTVLVQSGPKVFRDLELKMRKALIKDMLESNMLERKFTTDTKPKEYYEVPK